MLVQKLVTILDEELKSDTFKDYCPNGLQVEGRNNIQKIVCGVTASEALIQVAIEEKADAILVHHGYFWRGEDPVIKGMKHKRISLLLENKINLLAYHLPLDAHPILGNNAQLGEVLGLQNVRSIESIEPIGIVMRGDLPTALMHSELTQMIENRLGRQTISVGDKSNIYSLAWCTGGGQSFIDQIAHYNLLQSAVQKSPIDAFISGEISEQTTHSAIEQNIDFIAAGHHATERYGIKALGVWLRAEHQLDTIFVDIDNPA